MTELTYTFTIEIEKPLGELGLLGNVTAIKQGIKGQLYEGSDPAEQLERACIGLVADIRTKLRKAAERK